MIGQELLINTFNNYTLDTMPRSIILFGDTGSGRHTIVNIIADKFKLELINITGNVSRETILEYQQCPIDKLYLVDLDEVELKDQNKLLKFIEEPTKTMHVILLAKTDACVLNTALNRCVKYYLADYTIDQLSIIKQFENKLIYSICTTPGQLLAVDESSFNVTYLACEQFINDITISSIPKVLSFGLKVNYKENYDKLDFNLVLKIMLYLMYNKYITTNNELMFKLYLFTADYLTGLHGKLNKENFMTNYLLNLKEVAAQYVA